MLSGSTIKNPLKGGIDTLADFLDQLLDVVIIIAVPIVVLAVIYAGFLFVTAQGNVEKIDKAKKVIIWTLIGALIVLGAKVVSTAVKGTVDQITEDRHPVILVLNDSIL